MQMPRKVFTLDMGPEEVPDPPVMFEAILHIVQTVSPDLIAAPQDVEYQLHWGRVTVVMRAHVDFRQEAYDMVVVWRVDCDEYSDRTKLGKETSINMYFTDHRQLGLLLTQRIESYGTNRPITDENYGTW